MPDQLETTLRGPKAYGLARQVIEAMEAASVWPTPLNFEIWVHYLGAPEGPLGREVRRIIAASEPFTEATAELLAAEHLPRGRLTEEIRDAGQVLDRELSSVSDAISKAHRSQASFGQALDKVATRIETASGDAGLKAIVSGLTSATRLVRRGTETLEKHLDTSTREVARLREHLEQFRRDAMTDSLTNLANRKAFDEHLEAACAKADAEGGALILAMLDIDHVKRFNDTWGHQTGDQVLRYVASVMGRVAKAPRLAARYGGEEFAMIFPKENIDQVQRALETIRKEIASRSLRRRSTDDELGAVTLSVGFAERRPDETASSLLERADTALYASKHAGRNCVTNADGLDKAA